MPACTFLYFNSHVTIVENCARTCTHAAQTSRAQWNKRLLLYIKALELDQKEAALCRSGPTRLNPIEV